MSVVKLSIFPALLLVAVLSLSAPVAEAFSLGGITKSITGGLLERPFGGKILKAFPCTCNPTDWVVVLGPPSAGMYKVNIVEVALRPYLYGKYVMPTVNLLGSKDPTPTSCLMAGTPCVPFPLKDGTIKWAGTSRPGI